MVAHGDEVTAVRSPDRDREDLGVALGNRPDRRLDHRVIAPLCGERAGDGQALTEDLSSLDLGGLAIGKEAECVGGEQDADGHAGETQAESHHGC